MLSVTNSCHYNENLKNGKHHLYTNVHPSGAAPTNLQPSGKSLDAKAPGWGQIFGANPRGCVGVCVCVGGMVIDEIDTCIIFTTALNLRLLCMLATEHALLSMFLNIWRQILFP